MRYHRWFTPWVLVIPALAWLLVFNLWPSINTVILSFTNARPIGGGTFVGLKNFETLLHDEQLRWALLNSVIYMVVCLPFLTVFPLLLAVLVEKKLPGITFFRTAFYTPVVASAVVVALIWQWILDDRGLVNGLAEKLGVISGPLPFLSDQWLLLLSAISLTIWKGLLITIGPFLWQLSTSLKGSGEDIYTRIPRLLPAQPTFDHYKEDGHDPGPGLRAELAGGRLPRCRRQRHRVVAGRVRVVAVAVPGTAVGARSVPGHAGAAG